MYWNTVNSTLKTILLQLMNEALFEPFRLVGGTSLSLQLGHRVSVDIDLFSDAPYGSIDFIAIDEYLRKAFSFVTPPHDNQAVGMGKGYFIGATKQDSIKLDLYYTDTFIQPAIIDHYVRMASVEEIAAMKIDVVQRGGRKKDFWDIHEMNDKYSLHEMIVLHEQRYPYSHDVAAIRQNLTSFKDADNEFDPICLKGKYWEIIKLELTNAAELIP